MKATDYKKIWKQTGLSKMGDKEGLIELIQRDVSMEDLSNYFDNIDPDGEMMEEEFLEIVGDKLRKWKITDLLEFWRDNHYK